MARYVKPIAALAVVAATAFMLCSRGVSADEADSSGQFGRYTPNVGTKLANTDKGDVNLRLYAYFRYLNQNGLDPTYTDAFGNTTELQRRHDYQFQKVNIQFFGWMMDPKFRYLLYVWTANTSLGQVSQVVVGGNLNYTINPHLTVSGGIGSLPGVRTTEGNFPFWLTIDNRLMSDEFFRPSYTMGIWASGAVVDRLKYQVMLGNNLSQFGVDASQLDGGMNTLAMALKWFPTTGEFGDNGAFGDFDSHHDLATRLAVHFTRSDETRQGQPSTEAFENSQIRLSDGSIIFKPDLFGPGVQIDNATYHMASTDVGAKLHGLSIEGEYYWRWVDNFLGPGTYTLPFDQLTDSGFQLQTSAMLKPQSLQAYLSGSKLFGQYGNPWEGRVGLNCFPWKNRVGVWNLEYLHTDRSPVGASSLPYIVGGTGDIFHSSFQINF